MRDCTIYVAKTKGSDQLRSSLDLFSHMLKTGFLMTWLISFSLFIVSESNGLNFYHIANTTQELRGCQYRICTGQNNHII